ncbi:MAG: hypothetical protein IJX24_05525 [Oscillospiraceae bacterium]|nr:hypothetical protein [Oscillospiraceae bacterium]
MNNFLIKLFSKNKSSKVHKIKCRKKKSSYRLKKYSQENAIFEIIEAFSIGKNKILICGKVLNGCFTVGDKIKISKNMNSVPILEASIEKITTSLVEVNKINKGAKTDMLLNAALEKSNENIRGCRVYKY